MCRLSKAPYRNNQQLLINNVLLVYFRILFRINLAPRFQSIHATRAILYLFTVDFPDINNLFMRALRVDFLIVLKL